MNQRTDQPGLLSNLIWGAVFCGVAYFGYTYFFPSDRAVVRGCVAAAHDMSRRSFGDSRLASTLAAVDAASTIVIIRQKSWDTGSGTVMDIDYQIDGRNAGIMC